MISVTDDDRSMSSARSARSARSRSRSYRISQAAVCVAVAALAAGTVLALREGAAGAPPISIPLSAQVPPAAGAAVSSMPACTLPASAPGSLVLQASGACGGVVVATGTCSQTETPSLVLSAPAGEAGTLYLLVQTSGDGPATGEVPASVFAQVVRGTDFERWSDRAATVTADAAGRLHFDGVSLMPEPGTHATEPIVLHGVAGCAGQG